MVAPQNTRLSGSELVRAQRLIEAAAVEGLDIADLLAKHRAAKAPGRTPLVRELLDQFMRDRMRAKIRGTSVRWFTSRLAPLYRNLGNRRAESLARADLRVVLEGIDGIVPSTQNNYCRAWRAWWRWVMKLEDSPAKGDITLGLGPSLQKVEREGAAYLAVDDVRGIMARIDEAHRSAAALLFFSGIRPQEIWGTDKPPLRWGDINVASRIIRVPPTVAKTRKGRVIEGIPDTLWGWLKPGRPDEPVSPSQSQNLIRLIQVAGGFYKRGFGRGGKWERLRDWPHDATRHSFATYAVALTDNTPQVALWLGHEGNTTMLHRHYRGLATKADAEAFFGIRRGV